MIWVAFSPVTGAAVVSFPQLIATSEKYASGAHQYGHFLPLMLMLIVLVLLFRPFLLRALSSWLVSFLMVAVSSKFLLVSLLIALIRLLMV